MNERTSYTIDAGNKTKSNEQKRIGSINLGYDLSNIIQLSDEYLKQLLRFLIHTSYIIK